MSTADKQNQSGSQTPAETPANPSPAPAPQNTPENLPPKNQQSRSHTLIWFSIAIITAAILWFCYWLFYLRFHEYTDDAYANGNLININAAVPGSVVAFYADNTDLVDEGQLLVKLDETDYQITYERELTTLASTVLQVRQLYDAVNVNNANVDAKNIALQRALYDYENRKILVDYQAVSNEDFVHSNDDLITAQHNLEQAQFQLNAALSAAGNSGLEDHPLIETQKRIVRDAFYKLQHCSIYAPARGYVAQRAVQVGEWVTTTKDLLAVIPIDYVWVDANFKETQLTKMRIGQPAKIWLDIYGSDVEYHGKVLGIASGTGSVFSIIPPQNATGNWIKIVQRLPVRISLDPEQLKNFPTRLGLSAEVNVEVTDTTLPMLAEVPTKGQVCRTNIFNLNYEIVDKDIEDVIRNNLKKDEP